MSNKSTIKPAGNLTPKQKAFIIEYLVDFNATDAAKRAGYKGGPDTLAAIGIKNLSNPTIRRRINALLEEWAMPLNEVLLRLSRLARGSMYDFISENPDGNVKMDLLKALRSGAMDQVKYLVYDERRNRKGLTNRRTDVSLYDSLNALTQLARGYTLPSGVFPGLHQDQPQEDFETMVLELGEWLSQAAAEVHQWIIQTYGNIDTAIMDVGKKLFGEDFEPSDNFKATVYGIFKDIPDPYDNKNFYK